MPCSACGRVLYAGPYSLPEGQRTCVACRAQGFGPVRAAPRKCDRPDCERKHCARGLCHKHYYQLRAQEGLDRTAVTVWLNGVIVRKGKLSRLESLRCKVTVGLLVECPDCGLCIGGASEYERSCVTCQIVVRLNPEEVAWTIADQHALRSEEARP